MYWPILTRTKVFTPYGEFIKFDGSEIKHQSAYWVYIKAEDFIKNSNGILTIKNLHEYPIEISNFLIKGIAPLKVNKEFGVLVALRKVYITNATANSVVFYAMNFLNNYYSLSEIIDIRKKHSFDKTISTFGFDELKNSFISQSNAFLDLYRLLRENDRFEHFIDNILSEEKFKSIFNTNNERQKLKTNYQRKVFHQKLECEFMYKDFDVENEFHYNTGMFANEMNMHITRHYTLDDNYLEKMGMRPCNACFY